MRVAFTQHPFLSFGSRAIEDKMSRCRLILSEKPLKKSLFIILSVNRIFCDYLRLGDLLAVEGKDKPTETFSFGYRCQTKPRQFDRTFDLTVSARKNNRYVLRVFKHHVVRLSSAYRHYVGKRAASAECTRLVERKSVIKHFGVVAPIIGGRESHGNEREVR